MLKQLYFNSEEGVFTLYKNENIIQQDILNSIELIDDSFRHASELITIVDIHSNHMQINESSLSVIFEEIMRRIRKYSKVRLGVVVNCPVGVAFSLLLEYQLKNSKYLYKTFSSISAAKEWINNI